MYEKYVEVHFDWLGYCHFRVDITWGISHLVQWDGLTKQFVELVDNNKELLYDNYIKNWYVLSKKYAL